MTELRTIKIKGRPDHLFHRKSLYQKKPMNVTIDDSGAGFTYGRIGNSTLNLGWAQAPCSGCFAQPDPTKAYNQTWHDSTYSFPNQIPFASLIFNGTAVYVMGIIITSEPPTTFSLNNSRLFFELDGEPQGSYLNVASVGAVVTYAYDITFFFKENLPFGPHNITIMNGDGTQTLDSLMLLDRIIYTTLDTTGDGTTGDGSTGDGLGTSAVSKSRASVPNTSQTSTTVGNSGSSASDSISITSSTEASSTVSLILSSSTTASASQSPSITVTDSHKHTATILCAVLAVLLSLAMFAGGFVLRRHRKRKQGQTATEPDVSQVPSARQVSFSTISIIEDSDSIASDEQDRDAEPPSYESVMSSIAAEQGIASEASQVRAPSPITNHGSKRQTVYSSCNASGSTAFASTSSGHADA